MKLVSACGLADSCIIKNDASLVPSSKVQVSTFIFYAGSRSAPIEKNFQDERHDY